MLDLIILKEVLELNPEYYAFLYKDRRFKR